MSAPAALNVAIGLVLRFCDNAMSNLSRSHARGPRRAIASQMVIALLATMCLTVTTTSAGSAQTSGNKSLSELRAERERVRARKAKTASSVNALKASDSEVEAALAALTNDIEGQSSLLEESQRAVKDSEAEEASAKAAEAKALKELAKLKADIKDQAIRAFVESPTDETLELLSAESLADASSRKTLLEVRANNDVDSAERYRAVREDLGLARATSEKAAAAAAAKRKDVAARLASLEASHAKQEAFAAEVEDRLDAALAEAQGLASVDGALASQISAKQSQIARQLAAQRAAAQRRGISSSRRSASSGGGIALPTSGGGNIVNVQGIRVDSSIASNLNSMLNAARADGISLSGGGYRDPAGQIAVRRSNCGTSQYAIYQMPASSCSPPTARPGRSMHEQGLAIDFTQGGSTLRRSSSAYGWLKANAAAYGFYNLPSEAWHWSTNGN